MYRSESIESKFFRVAIEQVGMFDSITVHCVHKGEASMSWEFCLDPGMDLHQITGVVREAVEYIESLDFMDYSFSNPEMTNARLNMTIMLAHVIEAVRKIA